MSLSRLIPALGLALSFSSAYAAPETPLYLADAVQTDQTLKAEFARVISPLTKQAPWLSDYGTASPATAITFDSKQYLVFTGCKPHNCPDSSYAVLYHPESKKITAGAFVQNHYQEQNLNNTEIQWLEQADMDSAQVLGPFLF